MLPLLVGLIAAGAVYWLSTSVRDTPAQREGRSWVEYSRAYKRVAAVFFPLSAFVSYAAAQSSPDQRLLALLIAAAFWLGTVYLAYEFFFVSLGYDATHIYQHSPPRKPRIIPWDAVLSIEYSPVKQVFILRTDGYGSVNVSPTASGHQAFIAHAYHLLEKR